MKSELEKVKEGLGAVADKAEHLLDQTQETIEEKAEQVNILFSYIIAGIGHPKIVYFLKRLFKEKRADLNTEIADIAEFIGNRATGDVLTAIKKLDRRNRVLLTVILAGLLGSLGYKVFTFAAKKFKASETPLTWDLEQLVAPAFAEAIKEKKIKVVICGHPTVGRIALLAQQILAMEVPAYEVTVVNLATDELSKAPRSVQSIYNFAIATGKKIIGKNFVIVSDQETANNFIKEGISPEAILIMSPEYVLTQVEKEIIELKQAQLQHMSETGLSTETPLIAAFLEDNFQTIPNDNAKANLLRSYAPELRGRKLREKKPPQRTLVFMFQVNEKSEKRLRQLAKKYRIPASRIKTITTQAELQSFFDDDTNAEISMVLVKKYPHELGSEYPQDFTTDHHVQFIEMQEWMLLNAHLVISPSNENMRYATPYGKPTFPTSAFGPVEEEIAETNTRLSISLPWASLDRSPLSRLQCLLQGIPRHDLAKSKTLKALHHMGELAMKAPPKEAIHGIFNVIEPKIPLSQAK